MDKGEFERLRNLPGKRIDGDIVLKKNSNRRPLRAAKVPIINSEGADAFLYIEWNEETDAKTLNVFVTGTGPICRLEVDARPHHDAGRSHKHDLVTPDCPSENLKRNAMGRSDLQGKDLLSIFGVFCKMADINHNGKLVVIET
jgi:hypothetical protein